MAVAFMLPCPLLSFAALPDDYIVATRLVICDEIYNM